MAIVLENHDIAYFSVPKCGCSSLKAFFYHVDNGRPWEPGEHPKKLHATFPAKPYGKMQDAAQDRFRIAVVRDPVSRLASAYYSKVRDKKCLEEDEVRDKLRFRLLKSEPSFSYFVKHLKRYQTISRVVRRHTHSLTHHLGTDPEWFDLLVDLKDVSKVQDAVHERTGARVQIAHRNKSKSHANAPPVSDRDVRLIQRMFAEDYDVFGHLFTRPA